jgi:uncharacterized membrane protein
MAESGGDIGELLLKQLIDHTVFALESLITVLIIIIVVITLVSFFKIMLSSLKKIDKEQQQSSAIHHTVIRMLRGLLVSLDLLIAADILKTMLVPSINELGILVVVVVIRILLSWSMSKEIHDHRITDK